jgi:hypothetical protein
MPLRRNSKSGQCEHQVSVGPLAADTGFMTWLFPEPELARGEEIEGKTKAQLIPPRGRQTTGFLYLITRRLVFVPGRGTPKARAFVTGAPRGRCVHVDREDGRVSIGYGGGFWKRMRITLDDQTYLTFGVAAVDELIAQLRSALSVH